MRAWSVKSSGRIERLATVFFLVTILFLGFISYVMRRNHSTMSDLDTGDISFGLIILSVFFIPAIIIAYRKVMAVKIPAEVILDEKGQSLTIKYSWLTEQKLYFDQMAYTCRNVGTNRKSIIFFKVVIGTRGQKIYKEVCGLVGLRYTFAWKALQVGEIQEALKQADVEFRKTKHDEMSLLDELLGL